MLRNRHSALSAPRTLCLTTRIQELEYLNLSLNNIRRVEGLERCESLRRLDLTLNFIQSAELRSVAALAHNEDLRELHLIGNPCTAWHGYRQFVLGVLPQLASLDGEAVASEEKAAAAAALPDLQWRLAEEFGAAESSNGGEELDDNDPEREEDGALEGEGVKRPWCPSTRLQEHREQEQRALEVERSRTEAARSGLFSVAGTDAPRPPLENLPPLPEGAPPPQKNEGGWDFDLLEGKDACTVVLRVSLGRYIDPGSIQVDLQPTFVRLLAGGRLLQLNLPAEVKPDEATATRSRATGRLVIEAPLVDPGFTNWDVTCIRSGDGAGRRAGKGGAAEVDVVAALALARDLGMERRVIKFPCGKAPGGAKAIVDRGKGCTLADLAGIATRPTAAATVPLPDAVVQPATPPFNGTEAGGRLLSNADDDYDLPPLA
jgi:protein TilB